MQRILDPAQIEAFAQRAIPRIRLPDRAAVFSRRARRLRQLGEQQAIGHSIGDYLRLMASVADAQDRSLASIEVPVPSAAQLSQARAHRMPLLHAAGWPRDRRWLGVLPELCDPIAGLTEFPASVRGVCVELRGARREHLEAQADALLAGRAAEVSPACAPFIMSALQVYWVHLASRLPLSDVTELDVPGVCPVCGMLPVASVVRSEEHTSELQSRSDLVCRLLL